MQKKVIYIPKGESIRLGKTFNNNHPIQPILFKLKKAIVQGANIVKVDSNVGYISLTPLLSRVETEEELQQRIKNEQALQAEKNRLERAELKQQYLKLKEMFKDEEEE